MGEKRQKRVRFMGGLSRKLWWDIRFRGGTLVVNCGCGRWRGPRGAVLGRWRFQLPRVYWSPNGTPWHHAARNVFRAKYVEREECVCVSCRALAPDPEGYKRARGALPRTQDDSTPEERLRRLRAPEGGTDG